jgi:putative DNA primase/helicase
LRQEYFDFHPECKIWLASNHKPLVKEFSLGFWRKIRLIPFKIVIPEEERILQYDKILLEEKEGILNWILEGYKKWKEEKLKTPEEIKEATAAYKDQMDVLAEFIEECCIENRQVRTTTKELYRAYKGWCEENNEKEIVKKVFGRRLEERGYKSVRFGSPIQKRGWQGIELKNKTEELPY